MMIHFMICNLLAFLCWSFIKHQFVKVCVHLWVLSGCACTSFCVCISCMCGSLCVRIHVCVYDQCPHGTGDLTDLISSIKNYTTGTKEWNWRPFTLNKSCSQHKVETTIFQETKKKQIFTENPEWNYKPT